MPFNKSTRVSVDSIKDTVYYCDFKDCVYTPGSQRYFTSKRLLEQHFQKVHAEKKFPCSKCDRKFSTKWLRKNHELSCGRKWTCSCGVEYSLRETLLTHVRRMNHDIPEDIWITPKRLLKKMEMNRKPLVIVIQPVIQQPIALIVPSLAVGHNQKVVLPKQMVFRNDMATPTTLMQTMPIASVVDTTLGSAHKCNSEAVARGRQPRKLKSRMKTVAETQTSEEFECLGKLQEKLESRGSQCSGQIKKKRVVSESAHTHTQTTMESVVGRMKKKNVINRSRRKSVAIVTDSCELQPTPSLWPNIGDFFLPNNCNSERFPSPNTSKSSGTQTNPVPIFDMIKETCDSQTITDDFYPPSWWLQNQEAIEDDSAFMMNSDTLSFQGNINAESPNLLKSSASVTDSKNDNESHNESQNDTSAMNVATVTKADASNSPELEDFADLDSMFHSIIGNSSCFENNPQNPPLSDSHTQTSAFITSSILLNMETQTNDDFTFSDLEFFDSETQTPWEDACDFGEDLSGAQLSIESQTDFSTCDFLSRLETNSLSGRHIETQTSDSFNSPELINSEAQTLINSKNLFI